MRPEVLFQMSPLVEDRRVREFGERHLTAGPLSSPWSSGATWGVTMPTLGELVVKVGKGDGISAKVAWSALALPRMQVRGYPAL